MSSSESTWYLCTVTVESLLKWRLYLLRGAQVEGVGWGGSWGRRRAIWDRRQWRRAAGSLIAGAWERLPGAWAGWRAIHRKTIMNAVLHFTCTSVPAGAADGLYNPLLPFHLSLGEGRQTRDQYHRLVHTPREIYLPNTIRFHRRDRFPSHLLSVVSDHKVLLRETKLRNGFTEQHWKKISRWQLPILCKDHIIRKIIQQ